MIQDERSSRVTLEGSGFPARPHAGWDRRAARLLFAAIPLLWLGSIAAAHAAAIEFGRDIAPILSDNCFHCHGPDEKSRKAKLRFDSKDGAFRLNKKGQAVIVPGKSAESEIIRRLTSTDPDEVMPPPDSNRKLTPKQIEAIRRWVDEGARWGRHWAFEPIKSALPPKTKLKGWARSPIDAFVLARLEAEGLQPSPGAERARWLRRVSFDLTGLPPTPAELDAFLEDKSATAFEKVVDRLLASTRYGERMATEWLDLARYADTHGYQNDRYRAMWPWRDWVIQAFNQNLSFDQFVTWQLAGDLLLHATKEQRLATAFNRHHMQNEEGGVVEEEFRVAYVVDRVNTMGTAFLGLTFECTRCHDHKFDPLTQRDYYSLFSFFQNIDESGQTVYFGEVMPVPTMLLADDATDARLARYADQLAQRERRQPALRESARTAFQRWLADKPAEPTVPGLVASFSFDELKDNKAANSVDGGKPANAVENPQLVPGHAGQGVELTGENGFTFPGLGHFTRTDAFSFALWLQSPEYVARQLVLHHSRAPIDAGSRGYELLLEEGRPAIGLHHMWPGNSLKVRARSAIPTNEWVHVAFTYDGSSHAAGVRLYVNGASVALDMVRDGLVKDITYEGGEPDLALGYRFRDRGFKGGRVDELRIFNRALTALEIAHVAGREDFRAAWAAGPAALTEAQRDGLLDYYVATAHPPARQFLDELSSLRREQSRLVNPIPELMVMKELPQPKPAFILKRGAYDAPGEPVAANTPAALPPFPADAPRNRLGLARWLVAPENPLLARVTVNRAWQLMFGRGLVETSDNFGSQGTPPTHPELLDWLARDFQASGWNYQALLKKIALSATYRQSSRAPAGLLARDPQNQLLARGPARRLTAEMLRDQALAVSGLLAEKIGGPSVRPYQPDGLWEVAMGNPHYDQGHGDDLHRRSLYTFWKRTVPNPAMMTFDAADRSNCAVRRQSTSTPLQALALLNDPQIVEAARQLGERMLKEGGTTAETQVAWAFRLATSRPATAREVTVLAQLLAGQREIFSADPQAAAKLLAVGETANDPALPPAELAAATVLATTLLNHDEAVMRR